MGHRWYRVTIVADDGGEHTVERRFGEVVQIVKGKYSWFFTMHKALRIHRCDGCAKNIWQGHEYVRIHTPRFEMDDLPRVDRICRNCLSVKEFAHFKNVQVIDKGKSS